VIDRKPLISMLQDVLVGAADCDDVNGKLALSIEELEKTCARCKHWNGGDVLAQCPIVDYTILPTDGTGYCCAWDVNPDLEHEDLLVDF